MLLLQQLTPISIAYDPSVDLHIRLDGRGTLTGQTYQQIRHGVLTGRLRAGEALPPTRVLAARLGVSRNTVAAAYDRLVAEGFLTTRTGAGTFVGSLQLPSPSQSDVAESGVEARVPAARPLWAEIPEPPDLSARPMFDFRVGMPDARLFPYSTWRRLLGRQLRASAVGTGMPCPPAGHPGLRAAIARHLVVSRGVHAAAEDVLVTCGAQQAFDLIGRVLLEPGSCVAVEEPGYIPPRLVWQSLGARVVGVPVDGDGLVVEALPSNARWVSVTPSHQLPTGVAMSLRRRMALLSWARRHDATIVEDDYDTEFRYTNQPLEPLQTLSREDRVIYVGSFSKTLLPTLRVGYLITPPSLRHALRAAKFVADWHTTLPTQAALAEFIDEGGLARHVRRVRRTYRQRHDRIAESLAGPLSAWLDLVPSPAGLHISAFLKDTSTDIPSLLARTAAAGVGVFDFSSVSAGSTRPGFVFGYGAISTDRVDEGLRRIQECLQAT
jgi:GntR family transcriptional regulator/MocR family aminotransferase